MLHFINVELLKAAPFCAPTLPTKEFVQPFLSLHPENHPKKIIPTYGIWPNLYNLQNNHLGRKKGKYTAITERYYGKENTQPIQFTIQ